MARRVDAPTGLLGLVLVLGCAEPPFVADERASRTTRDSSMPRSSRDADDRGHPGVIISELELDLRTSATAGVVEILVEVGDRVRVGEVVARLDTSDAIAELEVATAELRALQAELASGRLELEAAEQLLTKTRSLSKADALASDDLDAAALAADRARLDLAHTQARIGGVGARIQRLKDIVAARELRSPRAGVVAARVAAPGDIVGPSSTVLRLLTEDAMRVRFAVAPDEQSRWSRGASVWVRRDGASGNAPASRAEVVSISPHVDAAALMVFIDARIVDGDAAYADGLAVWVLPSAPSHAAPGEPR